MDILLEQELIRQNPQLGQFEQELMTLEAVESALGDLESEGVSKAMDDFFGALRELSNNPESKAFQEQVLWSATAMTDQIRSLSQFLEDLQENVELQTEQIAQEINVLTTEIADYNEQIHHTSARGGNTNILEDRRDQAILDLAKLTEVQISGQISGDGTVGITAMGMPLVSGHYSFNVGVGTTDDNKIGIALEKSVSYNSNVNSGTLGALMNLRNEILPGIRESMDDLAKYIIQEVNRIHVQGVGSNGSFTALSGWPVSSTEPFSDWEQEISDGTIHMRVINQSTGEITREELNLTTADDITTLQGLVGTTHAAGVQHMRASLVGGALQLEAETGYKFDFLPALKPTPDVDAIGVDVGVSGIYSGEENEQYTCTVVGGPGPLTLGSSNVDLQVTDSSGTLVKTLNLGPGYAPGDRLEIVEGVFIELDAGTVANGEFFEINALASSDTTGVLAASGLNCFFEGTTAASMYVRDRIIADSSLLATARGQEMADNNNALKMIDVQTTPVEELGGNNLGTYHRQIVTGVGQSVANRKARKDSIETVVKQLLTQRENIGGVDINEEAAKLMMFENMFQATARYFTASNKAFESLLQIV
jgi:flagellar hook-associated protein 1 FlgK